MRGSLRAASVLLLLACCCLQPGLPWVLKPAAPFRMFNSIPVKESNIARFSLATGVSDTAGSALASRWQAGAAGLGHALQPVIAQMGASAALSAPLALLRGLKGVSRAGQRAARVADVLLSAASFLRRWVSRRAARCGCCVC